MWEIIKAMLVPITIWQDVAKAQRALEDEKRRGG